MAVEMGAALELARARNVSIPRMIAEDRVYLAVNPEQTQRNREGLGIYFSSFEFQGQEHVAQAEMLVAAGAKVFIAGNHINKLDIIARRMAFEAHGFNQFIDDAVYPCELEWFENPQSVIWMGGDHLVRVATVFDKKTAEQGKAQSKSGSEEEAIFATYLKNCDLLNLAAYRRLAKQNIQAIYPESRFYYDGRAGRAPQEVSGFFPRRDALSYILPVLTTGQEGLDTLGDMNSAEPVPIRVIAGQIYPVSVIRESLSGEESIPVDRVMASIVGLDPTFESDNPRYIKGDYVEFYRQIIAEAGHLFRYSEAA